MELTGDVLIGAPRPQVWAALNDTAVLARCIPGCESMDATSATERTARVAVKVGPVRARFTGHVRMDEVREGEGCTLHFEGQGGTAGMARGRSQVTLSDESGGTRLAYTVQASVAGKLGQVGGRTIDAAAKQMADHFFGAFQAEVAPPVEAAVPAEAPLPEAEAEAPAAVPGVAAPAPAAGPVAPTEPSAAPAPRPPLPRPAPPVAPRSVGEGTRILWFTLGALSTGFGVWLARVLFN